MTAMVEDPDKADNESQVILHVCIFFSPVSGLSLRDNR